MAPKSHKVKSLIRWLLLLGILCLMGISIWPSQQPVYQNKSFDDWFEASFKHVYRKPSHSPYPVFNVEPEQRTQFLEPFKAMAQPGVHRLSECVGRRDNKMIQWYRSIHSKLPNAMARHLPVPLDAKKVSEQAAAILVMMGDKSRTAIPNLIDLLQSQDTSVRQSAAQVLLALLGPNDGEHMTQLKHSLKDPDSQVRWIILQAHFKIDSAPIQTLSALLGELSHPDETHRLYAAERLVRFVPENADRIQPALEQVRNDSSSSVRRAVNFALASIPPTSKVDEQPTP